MDIQEGADSMACSVVVIKADVPQRSSGQGIELMAAGSIRESGRGEGDMSFEDVGKVILMVVRGSGRGRWFW